MIPRHRRRVSFGKLLATVLVQEIEQKCEVPKVSSRTSSVATDASASSTRKLYEDSHLIRKHLNVCRSDDSDTVPGCVNPTFVEEEAE